MQNHENASVRNIEQGEPPEGNVSLKPGGDQAEDRSSDETTVVAGATNDRA
jgi:hypothetical protein